MLDAVLTRLVRSPDPKLLVGFETADDAGVYLLQPDVALVQTVDFFTPIVDDPATFGQIAAANALSDVYAMGGTPLTALSVLGFPDGEPQATLQAILQGGLDKLQEAGCTLVGGHSVRDPELKFGYAVTGTIHPARILANAGAQAGDALVLTKALGTGVITTALKQGAAGAEAVAAAIASMLQLNRRACELMLACHPHAATDITGFGLLGHAREMAAASHVQMEIEAAAVPLLPGARACALGHQPGGLHNNRVFVEPQVRFAVTVAEELRALFYDPQTSGGLLIALPEGEAEDLVRQLRDAGMAAARIGTARPAAAPLLAVV